MVCGERWLTVLRCAAESSMDVGDYTGGAGDADPDDALYDSLEWEQQCWLVINA